MPSRVEPVHATSRHAPPLLRPRAAAGPRTLVKPRAMAIGTWRLRSSPPSSGKIAARSQQDSAHRRLSLACADSGKAAGG
eukprot:CAMPEP_0183345028 /NCGR_PEP_ID=MMETSP0164_2-20130417/10567_1 /TAXON_ID=221442 /ORGANISM="Coccolithus pelagicus ssp braarudi, Strain PLY182g" /LENGTH=79 /DNA_ID=CAMNT_0025516121 /DNA_START=28 /DNA_END=263 /DNA_ORIENTATION=+